MAYDDSSDAFSDRDGDEGATVADLRAFGAQVTNDVGTMVRQALDERDRDEARRERVTSAVATTTPTSSAVAQVDPLDEMARRLGISRESLERAAAKARAQEQAAVLRPYIAECIRQDLPAALDELLVDDEDDQRNGSRKSTSKTTSSKAKGNGGNGGNGSSDSSRSTLPDEEPGGLTPHWSERSLW